MPNYITNKLKIIGTDDQIHEVLDFVKIENKGGNKQERMGVFGIGTIDFNKITPMPRWVYGYSDSITGISSEDELKYGSENTSINWCRENWGTKWNAFNQSNSKEDDNTLHFETAWNGVFDLISKLGWIFPEVIIEYSYADEDLGYNVAKYKFKEVDILEIDEPIGGSKEAYELAFEVTSSTPESHGLRFNEQLNNYECIDTEL